MRALGHSLSNLSVKHRLSLLIATLPLGITLTSTGASYRGIKQAALAVGRERLLNLIQPLVNLSQHSTTNLPSRISTATNEPAVIAFLQSPSSVLQQSNSAQNPNGLQVQLWCVSNSLALSLLEGSSAAVADLTSEFQGCATEPFKVPGSTGMVKDIAAYRAVAAAEDNMESQLAICSI